MYVIKLMINMDDFIVTYACHNVHTYTNLLGDQIYCLVIIENIEFKFY